jgi:hypothetical protein
MSRFRTSLRIAKTIFLVTGTVFIAVYISMFYKKMQQKYVCKDAGGKFEYSNKKGQYFCNMPAGDAGELCIKSSQCESNACVEVEAETGKCYEWKEWDCLKLFDRKKDAKDKMTCK